MKIINRHIGGGVDKLGETYTVHYTSSVKDTFLPAVLREYADLLDSGHAPENTFIGILTQPTPAVYIKYGDEIAANTIFKVDGKHSWMFFTNVADKYQGRGLYRVLHKHYEPSARMLGAEYSSSLIHHTNERMLSVNRANGYEIEYHRTTKKLT